ncbi:hypothetical protein ABBQ38_001265 [Trebouxia sp. C0009 RCD-2024]
MPLGRSNCAAMEGWQSRLQAKILTAGVVGAFTGAVLSVLQQKRFFKHSLGTAASCMVCVGGFAACQETSRLLRCEDSAANSVVAGAATGALLLGLQRGRSASLPAAIVCSGAAGIGHLLYDTLQPVQMFQNWLVDNDLMDSPGSVKFSTHMDALLHVHRYTCHQTILPVQACGSNLWFGGLSVILSLRLQSHQKTHGDGLLA